MKNITDGLVIRLVKSKGAFDGEDVDIHGNLLDASVNAVQGNHDEFVLLNSIDKSGYKQYALCEAAKITRKGGIIRQVPIPRNPNHCQIHNITIKEANNLFSYHKDF